ncbi:MAG: hypothetical protein JNM77_18810 [Pseudonocardia sp.]|nr:hypothetical protein [Pseudonocardia sp.]
MVPETNTLSDDPAHNFRQGGANNPHPLPPASAEINPNRGTSTGKGYSASIIRATPSVPLAGLAAFVTAAAGPVRHDRSSPASAPSPSTPPGPVHDARHRPGDTVGAEVIDRMLRRRPARPRAAHRLDDARGAVDLLDPPRPLAQQLHSCLST